MACHRAKFLYVVVNRIELHNAKAARKKSRQLQKGKTAFPPQFVCIFVSEFCCTLLCLRNILISNICVLICLLNISIIFGTLYY
ncbi:hypothetical protein CLOSTMETH_02310 [[Clostridium] methylpentosum DSM 5476]|uniref:Uncharacterized protein n=1 Tax=[Clostridium] methylpentosum DSM 5476 TaxID=537013 RepID=C0EEM1_9FIRM|nr:hypothetical protein CLOSTMETH_02310 [[Clostridium] methylpentosum DSM 5476]